MHTIHINNVEKNVAYTHYLQFWTAGNNPSGMMSGNPGLSGTISISKDGGAYTPTTNSLVEIGSGLYKIILTSTEMNADIINIYKVGSNSSYGGHHAMIVTGLVGSSGGSGLDLDTEIDSSTTTPRVNPTIGALFALLARRLKRANQKL